MRSKTQPWQIFAARSSACTGPAAVSSSTTRSRYVTEGAGELAPRAAPPCCSTSRWARTRTAAAQTGPSSDRGDDGNVTPASASRHAARRARSARDQRRRGDRREVRVRALAEDRQVGRRRRDVSGEPAPTADGAERRLDGSIGAPAIGPATAAGGPASDRATASPAAARARCRNTPAPATAPPSTASGSSQEMIIESPPSAGRHVGQRLLAGLRNRGVGLGLAHRRTQSRIADEQQREHDHDELAERRPYGCM